MHQRSVLEEFWSCPLICQHYVCPCFLWLPNCLVLVLFCVFLDYIDEPSYLVTVLHWLIILPPCSACLSAPAPSGGGSSKKGTDVGAIMCAVFFGVLAGYFLIGFLVLKFGMKKEGAVRQSLGHILSRSRLWIRCHLVMFVKVVSFVLLLSVLVRLLVSNADHAYMLAGDGPQPHLLVCPAWLGQGWFLLHRIICSRSSCVNEL